MLEVQYFQICLNNDDNGVMYVQTYEYFHRTIMY